MTQATHPTDHAIVIPRREAYARAHNLLDLHELGYAVREYCMPEDEYRYVWHGKRYKTTISGIEIADAVMIGRDMCINYSVIKMDGELA